LVWVKCPEVAQQAAIALRRVGTEAAVVSLGEFLVENLFFLEACLDTPTQDIPTHQLNLTIEILRQLGWMAQPLVLDYLQRSLDHRSHHAPKLWLETVMILGRVENYQPQACKILITMLEVDHPGLARTEIKQALASSLGQLKEPAGRDALDVLLQDGDRSVQLHSQFALGLLSADH
jgi:HEAT repeat protein